MKGIPDMRSDSTPQVETREIADGDLDCVSGGVLGIDVSAVISPVVGTIDPIVPVSGTLAQVDGLIPAQVSGLLR